MFPVAVLVAVPIETEAGQGRSPIVLNYDGTGTTVVMDFPDSSFQAQQLWTNNSVNGIQAFTDGTFAFANCTPTLRTPEDLDLACRIYDEALGSWSEPPVATSVPVDFLDGDFNNPYNSLFEVTGQYLTVFDVGSESYSLRLRFLEAILTQQGFPILLGQTNPESRSAFLLRNVDVPGGTTNATNFSLGIQIDELCLDFDLNVTAPGATLVGALGARVLESDGSCGDVVVEDRPAALVPSGLISEGGATCPYTVLEVGTCSPVAPFEVDSTLCLPCDGTCRDFDDNGIAIVMTNTFTDGSAYIDCRGVVVDPQTRGCGRECTDGLPAIFFSPTGSSAELDSAVTTHISR
jgi:hypothetical protein